MNIIENINNNLNNLSNNLTGNEKSISLSKAVLVFYMLIASNFSTNIMSKQLKSYIEDNRLVQHLIGLISMIILITTFGKVADVRVAVIYAVVGYLWFLLTTKLDIHINVIVIILLLVGYLFETQLDIDESKRTIVLTEEEKRRITINNNKHRKLIMILIFIVTIIGTVTYSNKKQIQYGGGYSLLKYLLY